MQTLDAPISVIVTCQDDQSLHPTLRSIGITGLRMTLNPPTHSGRAQVLQRLIGRKGVKFDGDVGTVTLTCEGYLGGDLAQLLDRAIHFASLRIIAANKKTKSNDIFVESNQEFSMYEWL